MHFLIHCVDKPDALDLRMATRPAHLAYLAGLLPGVALGGAFLGADGKPAGSAIVIEAESLEAARRVAAEDPYALAGLFQSVTVSPYRVVFQNGAQLA